MLILSDNRARATAALGLPDDWQAVPTAELQAADRHLYEELAPARRCFRLEDTSAGDGFWRRLVIIDEAPASQFDVLRSHYARPSLERTPTACLALTGVDFHGHRRRKWIAGRGNLHLSVALFPDAPAAGIGLALTMLPAVAVIDALSSFPALQKPGAGRPGIKWVNDVLTGGAKLAGVLTTTLSLGEQLEQVVLGVGLNVLMRPEVEPTVFVPRVTCLADEAPADSPELATVLAAVLSAIRKRYESLLNEGAAPLFAAYREASLVIGREVVIWPEARVETGSPQDWPAPLAAGKVLDIKPDLSLILAGRDEVVTHGRLAFAEEIAK